MGNFWELLGNIMLMQMGENYAVTDRYIYILLYIFCMIEDLTPSVYNVTLPMVTCR